jgi:hypothetical protein
MIWPRHSEWITDKKIGRHANDRVICSCAVCGNPRRFTGEPTVQERRREREDLTFACHQ